MTCIIYSFRYCTLHHSTLALCNQINSTLRCLTPLYQTLLLSLLLYSIIPLYCILPYSIIFNFSLLCSTTLYLTLLFSIILCSTANFNPIRFYFNILSSSHSSLVYLAVLVFLVQLSFLSFAAWLLF